MKHYLLTAAQKAATGYTDLFVIQPKVDFTETTDNTDQTLTLDALAFGDIVENRALIEIKEALGTTAAGTGVPSADFACTISLGVTGATTQFIGASAIAAAGAATAAKTAYATAAGAAAYPVPSGGKNLLATVDITDADGSLAEVEYGEIWVWMDISRQSVRHDIQV